MQLEQPALHDTPGQKGRPLKALSEKEMPAPRVAHTPTTSKVTKKMADQKGVCGV